MGYPQRMILIEFIFIRGAISLKEITWDDFNYKNRKKTGSFEDMCRTLFLRTFKKSGYDYQYNYNQAGLNLSHFQ